jgi:hypothetical protein
MLNAQRTQKPKPGARAAQVRALALRYPELGPSALAKRVGCTPQSATSALKRFLANHSEDDLRSFQTSKADVYDAIQQRCLESVTASKLRKASATSLVTSAAILQDKSRIIRGMPTSLDVHVLIDILSEIRGDKDNSSG